MIGLNKIMRRNTSIESAQMGNEIGMLHIELGKYYVLNDIGADIWNRIEKPISMATLIENIIGEYDVEYDQCKAEVMEFANELISKKIAIVE